MNPTEITLIPGGTIQFWDAEFDVTRSDRTSDKKVKTSFYYENINGLTGDEQRANSDHREREESSKFKLIGLQKAASGMEDGNESWINVIDGKLYPNSVNSNHDEDIEPQVESINKSDALKRFANEWVPLPFFRLAGSFREDVRYRDGPHDWARAYIELIDESDKSIRFKVVLAFDTHLEVDKGTVSTGIASLTETDVREGRDFSLVDTFKDNHAFIYLDWVKEWIQHVYYASNKTNTRDKEHPLKPLAYYAAFLEALKPYVPKVKLINPFRPQDTPIDVDLVVDIGNARTIGLLCATTPGPTGELALDQSEVLEIRDLSKPTRIYGLDSDHDTKTFRSVICFSQTSFATHAFQGALDTGRTERPSFIWPSVARIGNEAARLAARSEGQTSLSSPKRYLWDLEKSKYSWLFARREFHGQDRPQSLPRQQSANIGSFFQKLKEDGIPTFAKNNDIKIPRVLKNRISSDSLPLFEPKFSRSSFMMFLIAEILSHAIVQINSPRYRINRGNKDIPRRVRRVILTMPPAMTATERKIYQQWAEWAIEIVWQTQGWKPAAGVNRSSGDFRQAPKTEFKLDEASATQLVFLYNELIEKHGGDSDRYVRLFGRTTDQALRIASIDIGGGTTDLVITKYTLSRSAGVVSVDSTLEFREGFNFAGDDLLKEIIENHLIQSLKNKNEEAEEKLGRNLAGMSQRDRELRGQFAQQILHPIAVEILGMLEESTVEEAQQEGKQHKKVRPERIKKILEDADEKVKRYIFSEEIQWDLEVCLSDVDRDIRAILKPYLMNLFEVVQARHCDFLLISGRPSRLPSVRALFFQFPAVSPSRIIPMSEYAIGNWYPFQTRQRKIVDPKTTGVVGAALAAVNDGGLANIRISMPQQESETTIKYLGIMSATSQISKKDELFNGEDLSVSRAESKETELPVAGVVRIGFRQFGHQRWKVTPFYQLRLSETARSKSVNTRIKATLAYERVIEDDAANRITDEGELKIIEVTDSEGNNLPSATVKACFITMASDDHWLDSGIFDQK